MFQAEGTHRAKALGRTVPGVLENSGRPVWLEWSEGGGEREEGRAGRRQSRLFRGLWVTEGLGTLNLREAGEPWRAVGREGDGAWLWVPLPHLQEAPAHLPRWSPCLPSQHPSISVYPTPPLTTQNHSCPALPKAAEGGGREVSCLSKPLSCVRLLQPQGL